MSGACHAARQYYNITIGLSFCKIILLSVYVSVFGDGFNDIAVAFEYAFYDYNLLV